MLLRKSTSRLSGKQYSLAAVALFASSLVFADRPAPERQYSVTSPNGTYEFTMHPTVHNDTSSIPPYGEALQAPLDDGPLVQATVLWRVDGWYSFETFITDDGRGLVRLGPWASKPPGEELAIAFYRDGREIKHYSVADLLENTESVERTVSHYTWQARDDGFPRLLQGDQFQLLTVENRVITFDVVAGRILSKISHHEPASSKPQVTREAVDD